MDPNIEQQFLMDKFKNTQYQIQNSALEQQAFPKTTFERKTQFNNNSHEQEEIQLQKMINEQNELMQNLLAQMQLDKEKKQKQKNKKIKQKIKKALHERLRQEGLGKEEDILDLQSDTGSESDSDEEVQQNINSPSKKNQAQEINEISQLLYQIDNYDNLSIHELIAQLPPKTNISLNKMTNLQSNKDLAQMLPHLLNQQNQNLNKNNELKSRLWNTQLEQGAYGEIGMSQKDFSKLSIRERAEIKLQMDKKSEIDSVSLPSKPEFAKKNENINVRNDIDLDDDDTSIDISRKTFQHEEKVNPLAVGAVYHQKRVDALLNNINHFQNLGVFGQINRDVPKYPQNQILNDFPYQAQSNDQSMNKMNLFSQDKRIQQNNFQTAKFNNSPNKNYQSIKKEGSLNKLRNQQSSQILRMNANQILGNI